MSDAPQAHLVVLVAGALLAATVLSVAAGQAAQADRARAVAAADDLASAVGHAECSARVPVVHIALAPWQSEFPGTVRGAHLMSDHVRVWLASGETVRSVSFRPLHIEDPIDLLSAAGVGLTYDPFAASCSAWALPAENP